MSKINILFVGDVFGKSGRQAISAALPKLKRKYDVDICIVNGENASHGRGLSLKSADELYIAGADCITMGNHTWDNNEIFQYIDDYRIIRPANFSTSLPGRGEILIECGKCPVGILNVQGQIYMDPCNSPFEAAYEAVLRLRADASVIIVDFHAEASSEKAAMALYLDGLVTAVVGTHTHIQTADEQILPGGTAFITDVGMTGPTDSVIGMDKTAVINKFVRCIPQRFQPATGPAHINAVLVEADTETGVAHNITRIKEYVPDSGK